MSLSTMPAFHYSPNLGRYLRCVAQHQCEFGETHSSLQSLAESGGAVISTNGHSQIQTVSPVILGAFSVGSGVRTRTFNEDGTQMTVVEAKKWRRKVDAAVDGGVTHRSAKVTHSGSKRLPPIEFREHEPVASIPREEVGGLRGSVADLQLAEHTEQAVVLHQLAMHRDPAVRLVVAQNPATPVEVLEELAMSRDSGSGLYQSAAMERLTEKYQDLRDEQELRATARMEADGLLQANLIRMPAYRVMLAVPKKRWSAKPKRARKRIVSRAIEEIAGFLGMRAQVRSWTRANRRAVRFARGARGVIEFHISSAVLMYKGTRQVAHFLSHSFAHASTGEVRGHGEGWRSKFREINRQLGLS